MLRILLIASILCSSEYSSSSLMVLKYCSKSSSNLSCSLAKGRSSPSKLTISSLHVSFSCDRSSWFLFWSLCCTYLFVVCFETFVNLWIFVLILGHKVYSCYLVILHTSDCVVVWTLLRVVAWRLHNNIWVILSYNLLVYSRMITFSISYRVIRRRILRLWRLNSYV